jgi:hypothetical protein
MQALRFGLVFAPGNLLGIAALAWLGVGCAAQVEANEGNSGSAVDETPEPSGSENIGTRVARPRSTLSPHLEAGGSLIRYLPGGFYFALELDALAYALPTESSLRDKEVVMRLAARLGLQLGIEFADF